jgi:hypothetical protein
MNTHRVQHALAIIALTFSVGVFGAAVSVADSRPVGLDRTIPIEQDTLSGGRCGTQIRFDEKMRVLQLDGETAYPACPVYGPCDDPATRDLWTFEPGGSSTTVRLAVHVVAYDDGTYPFATAEEIRKAIDSVNMHYIGTGIQFTYTLNEIRSSDWRVLEESEIDPMKIATAADPTKYLNIWLTSTFFGYAFGTFPFDPNVFEPTGGIILGQWHWGGNHTGLAHEIGHCLGLWHNFHGVNEVTKCGPCYESVESEDRDLVGDLCADTPPGPAWYECSDAVGIDSCADLPWGATQPENIMGYAPTNCRTLFTPQQEARMRCWIDDILSGWVEVSPPCCIGRVGDANGSGSDTPTIGDVSAMIDAKFISSTCAGRIGCIAEADINQSAVDVPACNDITIGDISILIDYLFLTGPEAYGPLPDCQ